MYTCAGICYYQKRGPYEQCNIRLSQPLLALRPRGDLVNTLIHEMIHAFLFVTHKWVDFSLWSLHVPLFFGDNIWFEVIVIEMDMGLDFKLTWDE